MFFNREPKARVVDKSIFIWIITLPYIIRQSRLRQMRKVRRGETPVAVATKQDINIVRWTNHVVTVASTVSPSRPEEEVHT